ncbi:hemerythrin domain-containing protein [Psychrobacter fulvigenes]|uniref:hemerythrin domain-containing protein n=1 Tax=Psychrobacter fulvigenes TaxID=533323 RepID=UPI0019189C4D|nr:hemerythrin domain-containing protein [Psychrobacter fulvigenes]
MKRANQLQPLSRQHHLGLNIARHAKECPDDHTAITKHWSSLTAYLSDMHEHFHIEDTLIANALLPYKETQSEIASVLETLEKQHKSLYEFMAKIKTSTAAKDSKNSEVTVVEVKELGTLLYDHIRFEERELFPIVERYLTEEELDAIYAASPDSIKRMDEER